MSFVKSLPRLKNIIVILVSATLAISCIIGVYYVINVSAILPSIKEYTYRGSPDQLITKIKLFVSNNPYTIFEVGQVLGNKSNIYAYDVTLIIKDQSDSLLYELKFVNIDEGKTKILLIGAHDLQNNMGGYGIKATGMKGLLDKFDSKILLPLREKNSIVINSL